MRSGSMTRKIVFFLMILFIPCLPFACEVPTFVSITPDGHFEDWTAVHSNRLNTVLDGYGKANCSNTPDMDCPISDRAGDIRYFAWTMDETTLSLYFEGFVSPQEARSVYVFIDSDLDGLIQAGEVMIHLKYEERVVDPVIFQHSSGGAIELTDAEGFADGFSPDLLSATFSLLSDPPPCDVCGVPSGKIFEVALDLSDLGLAAFQPFNFHVSTGVSEDPTDGFLDNLGSSDRGIGTTGYVSLDIGGWDLYSVAPDTMVDLFFKIGNSGNLGSLVNVNHGSQIGCIQPKEVQE